MSGGIFGACGGITGGCGGILKPKGNSDFYLIKDGVVASGYTFIPFNNVDSYGTSGGFYLVTDNEQYASGVYIGIDLTNISSIELAVKNLYGNADFSGLIQIQPTTVFTSPIYTSGKIINTTLQTITIDTSNKSIFTGVKYLILAVNNTTAGTTTTLYTKDIILKQ